MSSANGTAMDRSPGRKSTHSVETHRTRHSYRSRSRSRDRHSQRHDRAYEEKRRRSSHSKERKSERSRRDRRSRSHERSHRDRERERDYESRPKERRRERDDDSRYHDRNRDHRRDESRHGHRGERERGRDYHERDDKGHRERRRKRSEDRDGHDILDSDDRIKRKRESEEVVPSPRIVSGIPSSPNRDENRSSRPREREGRLKTPVDPRDEFSETMRGTPKGQLRDIGSEKEEAVRQRLDDQSPISRLGDDLEDAPRPRVPSLTRRGSPNYASYPDPGDDLDQAREDDSEARSVFVSQLAAKMTARDLGYFFEDKLGENSVMDSRIVTDRLSRRSKGIAYVEFRNVELVEKAIALSGTIVMGLPIMVQLTESERNKTHAGDGSLHLPPGARGNQGAILYVGSLHFNLTESDIRQVFEPFGALDFVDLHRDPMTGRSKGYAFVQYKRPEDAKMALEQMEGFELAGRTLRVNTVHEKGSTRYSQQDSLDENGGGNLNAASRQALMQKLARIENPPALEKTIVKPNIPQMMTSKSVLLRNMFDPDEETERDWDTDLAEDVKGECEAKYGTVLAIKVEKDSEGEIYVQFDSVDAAKKAIDGLNGRWFGGKQISAGFISDAIMQAHR